MGQGLGVQGVGCAWVCWGVLPCVGLHTRCGWVGKAGWSGWLGQASWARLGGQGWVVNAGWGRLGGPGQVGKVGWARLGGQGWVTPAYTLLLCCAAQGCLQFFVTRFHCALDFTIFHIGELPTKGLDVLKQIVLVVNLVY